MATIDRDLTLTKSLELKRRAAKVVPSITQTYSKGPTQFVQGVSPVFLHRGSGCRVWDVDGNEYIDCIAALGPIILGYNWPSVTKAVKAQIEDGTILSLSHPLEVELAELLVEIIPCAEMVRYAKNGSDVTAAAVRLARAYSGREKIACCGYHGWHDWFVGTTTRPFGVPHSTRKLTLTFEYNNLDSLERLFVENDGEIAAVIMEPVGVVEPENGFLERVKEITHRNGALLIFDEVVTGFRLALGGAQEFFGVQPDLACFGKAMANGFPLSAVAGKREIMSLFDKVFFSSTFGGETGSLAAAVATIKELRTGRTIPHIWKQGRRLKEGYNRIADGLGLSEHTRCIGYPPHTVMTFTPPDNTDPMILRSLLQQEMVRRGVLYLSGINTCFSHSDSDVEAIIEAFSGALDIMAKALNSDHPGTFLKGEAVQAVFRRA